MKCKGHTHEMHRHIVLIAIQHHLSTGGSPVVPAVSLTCDEVNEILADVVARAPDHAIGHKANPIGYMNADSPHLSCSYCGNPFTILAEEAYCAIVLHMSLSEKQSPR